MPGVLRCTSCTNVVSLVSPVSHITQISSVRSDVGCPRQVWLARVNWCSHPVWLTLLTAMARFRIVLGSLSHIWCTLSFGSLAICGALQQSGSLS